VSTISGKGHHLEPDGRGRGLRRRRHAQREPAHRARARRRRRARARDDLAAHEGSTRRRQDPWHAARQPAPAADGHFGGGTCAIDLWGRSAGSFGAGAGSPVVWLRGRGCPGCRRPISGRLRAGLASRAAAGSSWKQPLVAGVGSSGAALLHAPGGIIIQLGSQQGGGRVVRRTCAVFVSRVWICNNNPQTFKLSSDRHSASGSGSRSLLFADLAARQPSLESTFSGECWTR